MKKYIDFEGFNKLLEDLKSGEKTMVFVEDEEGNAVSNPSFMKIDFVGNTVILFENPFGGVSVIQDSEWMSYEDYMEELYYDLEESGDCKLYIEE